MEKNQKLSYNEFPTRSQVSPLKELKDGVLMAAKIPVKFRGVTIENFNFPKETIKNVVTSYINNIHLMIKDNCSLVLIGSNGTGKTMLSSIILQEALKRFYDARYITMPQFINAKFSNEDLTEIYDCDILVIDELGAELELKTQAEIVSIEGLLKYREENQLPFIICSNLNLEQISKRYGNTIFSIIDSQVKIEFLSKDMRKENARKTEARKLLLKEMRG